MIRNYPMQGCLLERATSDAASRCRLPSLTVPDCEHPVDGRNALIPLRKRKLRINAVLKHLTLAAALGLSMIHSLAELVAFSTPVKDSPTRHQDKTESEPDYKINHCFNIGNRDGYTDHKKTERREHHPKCLSSEASESYMSGYEEGFGGYAATV